MRSIPELVWALVFVRVVGLGPTAGVLAIALTYIGMLGKVYAEILESADQHATRTLLRNGSSRLQAFCFALLPACASELTSYTIYRWECAVRSSVVLGFVGAGGLGQEMDNSMKMFAGAEVATMLLVFFALVALVDGMLAALPLIEGAPLTLKRILGWALAPVMWLIGVPWGEAQAAGSLMGTKAVLNEYVAYLELAALSPGTLGPRGTLIVTYALCGVANLASVGLLVSTIGTLAPERRAEAAGLGMKSWIAGNLASLMTGAWIGLVTW